MTWTGTEGVDVVINSDSSEEVRECLILLRGGPPLSLAVGACVGSGIAARGDGAYSGIEEWTSGEWLDRREDTDTCRL